MTDKPTAVWIVEDVDAYRDSLSLLFESEAGMDCAGAFASAEAALRELRRKDTSPPEVLLLDIGLPGMSGLDGIPKFLEAAPDLLIIVLTVFEDKEKVLDAISCGATGYLLKSADSEAIIRAVHEVLSGGSPLTPKIARQVLSTFSSKKRRAPQPNLSDREKEILDLLADGLIKKEVADKLGISYHTVDYHVRSVYKKLCVNNLPGAIAAARVDPVE